MSMVSQYAAMAAVIVLLTPVGRAQSFKAAPLLNTAHDVSDFVSADFNRDGKPDLAFIDSSNTLNVWLGTGNGSFTTGQTIPINLGGVNASRTPVQGNASNILTADINHDGKPDLVVASEWVLSGKCAAASGFTLPDSPYSCTFSSVIQIDAFLSNGDGTFQAAKTTSVDQSYSIQGPLDIAGDGFPATGGAALADFNGDGNLDIAIPDPHSGALIVLKGDGTGAFSKYPNCILQLPGSMAYGPGLAIAASTRKNGHQDLIILTQVQDFNQPFNTGSVSIPGQIQIYLGNGDGTFEPPTVLNSSATSLLVTDINGDGYPDLVTTQADYGVQIFAGNGDGTFTAQSEIPSTNGAHMWVAGVADYNSDGNQDIALIGEDGISILLGQGGLNFAAPVAYPVGGLVRDLGTSLMLGNTVGHSLLPLETYGLLNPTIYADFNGDGRKDFLVRGGDGITLLLGNGDGTFQSDYAFEVNHFSAGLATADFNKDGNVDIAAAVGPESTRILLGNGDGTMNVGPDPAPGIANTSSDGVLATGDFSSNGFAGVAGFEGGAWVQYGDGTGNLGVPFTVPDSSASFCCGASGDFNNDGLSDLALVSVDNAYFLTNQGGGVFSVFTAPLPDPYPPTVPPEYSFLHRAISLGDFNGDGFVDAAIATLDSSTGVESVQILLGNGDGTFALGQQITPVATFPELILSAPIPTPMSFFTPTIADVNGDGILDIAEPNAGSVQILYGNGDGTFQAPVTFIAPSQNFTLAAVADFNFDGIPDIALSDSAVVSIFYGKKGGGFTAPVSYGAGDWPWHMTAVDVNNDGAPDLVFASGTDVVVMLNNPPPGSFPVLMSLAVTPEPSDYKQPFTTTANVTAVKPKNGNPSGTVAFTVDDQPVADSTLTAGTASAVDSVVLSPGFHKVTATYSGDSAFHSRTLSVQHQVLGMADTVTLTGSPNPANLGQSVTFTAVVTGSGNVIPTGKIQFLFLDGVTPEQDATLDGTGTATVTQIFSTSGAHRLKAHYAGDSNFSPGTSNILTEIINAGAGDFTITLTPASASVRLGLSTTFTVTMTSLYGFNQLVNLACVGAEVKETTCTFNPNPVLVAPNINVDSPPGTSTMNFSTTPPHTPKPSSRMGGRQGYAAALAAGALILFLPRCRCKRGILLLLSFAVVTFEGCGSGPIDTGTPFGTFTFTVTATAANTPGITHSVPVKITVH
jgi:hypothetical protein